MDRKYLEEHGLLESVNRFQQILEYTYAGGANTLSEDGEDDQNTAAPDPNMGGEDQNMMGGDPSMAAAPDPNMGADPNMGGEEPSMMGGDPNMVAGPEGFAPQGADPTMGGDPNMAEEPEDDEEVIDVDELVDSQEEAKDKIDDLTSKFDKLLTKIDDFENRIDASNERMETLRAEIEKRNPTPVEKLSLRSKDAYPFNVSPEDYWKDKEATSNYSTEDDENGANDRVYQITKDEIDNFNDYASAYRSLDDYTLNDMFGF